MENKIRFILDSIYEQMAISGILQYKSKDCRISMPEYLWGIIVDNSLIDLEKTENSYLYGIKIIPAYENKITIFHVDFVTNNIKVVIKLDCGIDNSKDVLDSTFISNVKHTNN